MTIGNQLLLVTSAGAHESRFGGINNTNSLSAFLLSAPILPS
jgi:hypothetical protein